MFTDIVGVVPRSINAKQLHTRRREARGNWCPRPPGHVGPDLSSMLPRIHTQPEQTEPSSCAVTTGRARPSEFCVGQGTNTRIRGRGRRGRRRRGGEGQGQGRGNRWVLGIPGLLLLELFAVVLFTVDTGTAVPVLFTGDEDLFLAVAVLLPAGRKVGRGGGVRRRDLTTFPPGLVVGEVEVELLVGSGAGAGLARLLLVVVAVRRGEDAEGDGDSRFKIQVDCLVWARRVVLLSTS